MEKTLKTHFLKKRQGALLIFIAVAMLGTLYGVNRSLGREIRIVSDYFYEGVNNHKGIKSQLDVRCDASMNLITAASGFEVSSEELRAARNYMKDMMTEKTGPSSLYQADRRLDKAFHTLYSELIELDLSEKVRRDIGSDYNRFIGAANVISIGGYNETVRAFNRDVLSVFPTNLLRKICFVNEPELFE